MARPVISRETLIENAISRDKGDLARVLRSVMVRFSHMTARESKFASKDANHGAIVVDAQGESGKVAGEDAEVLHAGRAGPEEAMEG